MEIACSSRLLHRPLPELALQQRDQSPQRIHLRLQVPDAVVRMAVITLDLDEQTVHGPSSNPSAFATSARAMLYTSSVDGMTGRQRQSSIVERWGIRSRIPSRAAAARAGGSGCQTLHGV